MVFNVVGCLTSKRDAGISQGGICLDKSTCYHTKTEVADQTFYLIQSLYTDTGPTSSRADLRPQTEGGHYSTSVEVCGMAQAGHYSTSVEVCGMAQAGHYSTSVEVCGMTSPGKQTHSESGNGIRSCRSGSGRLATWPTGRPGMEGEGIVGKRNRD